MVAGAAPPASPAGTFSALEDRSDIDTPSKIAIKVCGGTSALSLESRSLRPSSATPPLSQRPSLRMEPADSKLGGLERHRRVEVISSASQAPSEPGEGGEEPPRSRTSRNGRSPSGIAPLPASSSARFPSGRASTYVPRGVRASSGDPGLE
jgi:hypothetical protein